MQEFMQSNIKEIIERFPAVGDLLAEQNVACVSCGVGTCMLQDVMEIHNLSPDQERQLMTQLARIFYPGEEVEIPKIVRKPKLTGSAVSPPIRKLMDEHSLIKRVLHHVPDLIAQLKSSPDEARRWAGRSMEFIQSYADRFHHAKEEDVLFPRFDQNAEIFQVMLQDHEKARGHVRSILDALESGDDQAVRTHLTAYRELLTEHITKEDEVLYPWIDRNLTDSQVGELFARFATVDEEFGDIPTVQQEFVEEFETRFSGSGA